MAHSVSDHLHVMIADYDRFIRTVIPHYETMRAVQLELLAPCLPPDGRVVDLGGGTGALARAVAEKFPGVDVEIWDTDPAMLEVARERCAAFGDRVHFVERSFVEPLPACDAVVACIALHHVKDIPAKGKIYANIFQALRLGGIFANADCVMSETPAVRTASYESWAKFMEKQGLSSAEAQQQFAQWAKEDYYLPLATELRLLGEAGFAEPDCFWRTAPFTVFGSVRS
jgi:tRNA (cmo5U34)-methyltransferase